MFNKIIIKTANERVFAHLTQPKLLPFWLRDSNPSLAIFDINSKNRVMQGVHQTFYPKSKRGDPLKIFWDIFYYAFKGIKNSEKNHWFPQCITLGLKLPKNVLKNLMNINFWAKLNKNIYAFLETFDPSVWNQWFFLNFSDLKKQKPKISPKKIPKGPPFGF